MEVDERSIALSELECASEAFCTGTGASVTAVGEVALPGSRAGSDTVVYNADDDGVTSWGPVGTKLLRLVQDIQHGVADDSRMWVSPCPTEDLYRGVLFDVENIGDLEQDMITEGWFANEPTG